MSERWLPVPGYEGLYSVSDLGRVRSEPREVRAPWGTKLIGGRVLKPTVVAKPDHVTGYARTSLHKEGERRQVDVHTLVLEAFIGPRPPGQEACHADDVGTNNVLTNLRWGTRSDNIKDQIRNGSHHCTKTTCKRGHQLFPPNLIAANSRRGARACRACNCAKRKVRDALNYSGTVLDVQTVSDEYYARIMGH